MPGPIDLLTRDYTDFQLDGDGDVKISNEHWPFDIYFPVETIFELTAALQGVIVRRSL